MKDEKILEFEKMLKKRKLDFRTIEDYETKRLRKDLYYYNFLKMDTLGMTFIFERLKKTETNENVIKFLEDGIAILPGFYEEMIKPDIEYTIYDELRDIDYGTWNYYLCEKNFGLLSSMYLLTEYAKAKELSPQELLAMYPKEEFFNDLQKGINFLKNQDYLKYKDDFDKALKIIYRNEEEKEMEEETELEEVEDEYADFYTEEELQQMKKEKEAARKKY